MAREVVSFKEFLEIVREAYGVELNNIPIEALDSAWVNIPMDKSQLVHVPNTF